MPQISEMKNGEMLQMLYSMCSSLLQATAEFDPECDETDIAKGVCLQLLLEDMKITIETGPEIRAEIDETKASEQASH
jgi:hypothetical protein